MSVINSPEELLKEYEKALSFQSFDKIRDLISEDAIFLFTDGSHFGVKAIEKAFVKTFDLIKEEKYWISEISWLSKEENSASCTYNFHWKGLIKGKEASGNGRGTSILKKIEKKWLIVHEHLSRDIEQSDEFDK